ncbi:cystinosin homolog [Agrilus planipennis]|uniref:Cystinosin homolog n=1 Tax=Agrilus planipennis TaxID=224129 RepID=A0A7F5RIN2_AGRPL|nr:cystinosin homolog [Agrilus planipennis]
MDLAKRQHIFTFIIVSFLVFKSSDCDIRVSTQDLDVRINENTSFDIIVSDIQLNNVKLNILVEHDDILKVFPSTLFLNNKPNSTTKYSITVKGTSAGSSDVYTNSSYTHLSLSDVFVVVNVYKNKALDLASIIIGWTYFVAWSISFYPQIYINFRRKSVVGLNFDYVGLNIVGFIMYSIFNLGLYIIPELQNEYSNRYPRGLNPVQINDVFFSVHAVAATFVVIVQCFIYDRGNQKVSFTARTILGGIAVFLGVSVILSSANVVHWLDFVYFCSYIKLAITLIKYIPQAYMNYKRKSTVGWSIENILLDFTGGILSMLQMILSAYNYDDWASIFGDPTKFGLGLFSVLFDILFILQHYVFYYRTNYEEKS